MGGKGMVVEAGRVGLEMDSERGKGKGDSRRGVVSLTVGKKRKFNFPIAGNLQSRFIFYVQPAFEHRNSKEVRVSLPASQLGKRERERKEGDWVCV